MVRLFFAIVGIVGKVFHIDVDENEVVAQLKDAIITKNWQTGTCDAMNLTLFLAKTTSGEWLPDDETLDAVLRSRDVSAYVKMRGSWKLSKPSLFGPNVSLGEEVIHVLVVVPERTSIAEVWNMGRDASRRKTNENIPLRLLWQYSMIQRTTLPLLHEMSTLLLRPLPFQVKVSNFSTMKSVFDPKGPFLVCEDLTTLINAFTLSCDYRPDAMSSEITWKYYYDQLLNISLYLFKAGGVYIESNKTRGDTAGITTEVLRPDFFFHYHGMVLFRGEESSPATRIDVALNELTKKMRVWHPMLYGTLPYILGYATSGEQLRVVMIDRNLQTHTILEFLSIFENPAEVIKTFYNLTFFLYMMSNLSKRVCPSSLLPFTPHVTDKGTIELLDDVILRTIRLVHFHNDADFNRLTDIYTALEDLNMRVKVRTYLQTVKSFSKTALKKGVISVRLSPLGHKRYPEDEGEVREWLRCMLTALKYWHSLNYCHGDVCWPNIVYTPASHSGYWVLIDMDKSRQPNTTTIDWNHEFEGHQLNFQHDLYQLGHLMETLWLTLPYDLVDIKTTLLSAVDRPALTADIVLATLLLNQLHHH